MGGLCLFFCLGMATLKRVQVFCRYGKPVERWRVVRANPVAGFALTTRHLSGFLWGPPTQDTGRW